jgi:hypothetical protein
MLMRKQEKILRVMLTSMDSVKDTVETNVVGAVRAKQLTVAEQSLPGLLLLVKKSIDDGFQKSYATLTKQITAILDEEQVAEKAPPKRSKK